jgi:hypothetical protein
MNVRGDETMKSTLLRLAALALIAAAPVPAFAQAQPKAPSFMPATPPVNDAQFALGKELVTLSGLDKGFEGFIPGILREMQMNFTRTRPEIAADLDKVLKETILPEFNKRTADMVDQSARILANSMSEQELKETVAFLKTSAGKKYVETQPLAMNKIMQSMDAWNRDLSVTVVERVRAEMKKKGHDL